MRQAGRRYLETFRASRTLDTLVGAHVEVQLRAARRQALPPPLDGGIGVDLAQPGVAGLDVTIEVETALAATLTARALKRAPPRLAGLVGDAAMESLGGGLAAIVVAASRSLEGPLQVRAAGGSAALLAKRRAGSSCSSGSATGREIDTGTFGVTVDGETFLARLFLHATPPASATVLPLGRDQLRRLGSAPLEIPIVAATALSTVADVAALELGDAWMLGAASWARTLRGNVVLAAPGAERGARAALVDGGVLVLRAGSEEVTQDPMPEEAADDAITLAVGDVPVVVRVEVGAACMTAREWASLAVGDTVSLARALAEPVTLRVGGVEVAKGELVDIEGEMGVRIISLPRGGRAP
jgi:flagellar motor switch/type III secretory pathway protein FliN